MVRAAARPYQMAGGSLPSSPHYTPRKPSAPAVVVAEDGVLGDYNHHRTAVMKSTRDRAISILTTDVGSYVRSLDGGYYAGGYADGDLGENLLVDGVDFDTSRWGGCIVSRRRDRTGRTGTRRRR